MPGDQWLIIWSTEVKEWYSNLDVRNRARADRVLELLADRGPMLGMPQSRLLGEGLRELRSTCEDVARRITYTLDADRKVITLTTFRKQRQNENRELARARNVLKRHRAGLEADGR